MDVAARVDTAIDRIASFAGSKTFFLLHALWFAWWLPTGGFGHDPFPYGFLTLSVSLEAIFLSNLILMSERRQEDRERAALERERAEVTEIDTLEHDDRQLLAGMQDALGQHSEMLGDLHALLPLIREIHARGLPEEAHPAS